MLFVKAQVVLCAMVGQIQVVCVGRPFSCHCVNLLHYRQDGPIMTQLSDRQLSARRGTKGLLKTGWDESELYGAPDMTWGKIKS